MERKRRKRRKAREGKRESCGPVVMMKKEIKERELIEEGRGEERRGEMG